MPSVETQFFPVDRTPRRRTAVALSGGGFRAAAFSAGVLMYLIDAGRADDVVAVTSVSGGSITNAYFARHIMTTTSRASGDPWRQVLWLLAFLAQRDVLSPKRVMMLASAALVPTAVLTAAVAQAEGATTFVTVAAAISVGVLAAITTTVSLLLNLNRSLELSIEWLLQLPEPHLQSVCKLTPFQAARRLVLEAIRLRFVTHPKAVWRDLSRLGEVKPSYAPVWSATDLASGSQLHISTAFVSGAAPDLRSSSSLQALAGAAPDLPTATAVAASAAYPLIFSPVVVSAAALGLPARRGVIDQNLLLADGGLFDNLAVTALNGWFASDLNAAVLHVLGPPPEAVLVVDSGRHIHRRERRGGLLRSVARSINVVHQANTLARRQDLDRLFSTGERDGFVISLDDDPYLIAERCKDPVQRAAVIDWLNATEQRLGVTRLDWHALAEQHNPSIPTNLRGLGARSVASLVLHGYAIAMASTASELGWPVPSSSSLPASLESDIAASFTGSFWHRLIWTMSHSRG